MTKFDDFSELQIPAARIQAFAIIGNSRNKPNILDAVKPKTLIPTRVAIEPADQ